MSAHTPRTFEVPAALVAAGYSQTVDLDVLDREVEFPGEYGEWAEKVLFSENAKTLEDVCGDMRLLPRGILASTQLDDGSILVSGLVSSDGRVWDSQFNAWGTPNDDVDVVDSTIILEDDEVAFVARALREGADEVWFRPYIPKAFVSAVVAAPPPPQDRLGKKAKQPEEPAVPQEVPAGSAIVAVVDPIDEDAVLEMLAISRGPHVYRRHDGQWFEDPEWIPVLKSVRPPKIVKLTEPQIASVSAQVDRSTDDQDWEPFEASSREQYQIFTASAYIKELQDESDEKALFALVAVAGRELSPQDVKNTEKLKRYWTVGKGAAKIRWGTPGSWRRCYRHLVKYVGPAIAPGYCTNLSKRLGGPGVATHVTSAVEPVVAANPSGVNGYDKGKSFEESTGGVERDASGQFAQENGSHSGRFRGTSSGGGDRAARRRASIARSRKARADKESKKSDSAANKAKREADKAKREAQQKALAQLSLEIAQAVAAGNTIKAAELRLRRAELRLQFADTEAERINAETAVVNARTALARARTAAARKRRSTTSTSTSNSTSAPPPAPTLTADDIDKVLDDEYNRDEP
jgi:hypothetical protein